MALETEQKSWTANIALILDGYQRVIEPHLKKEDFAACKRDIEKIAVGFKVNRGLFMDSPDLPGLLNHPAYTRLCVGIDNLSRIVTEESSALRKNYSDVAQRSFNEIGIILASDPDFVKYQEMLKPEPPHGTQNL